MDAMRYQIDLRLPPRIFLTPWLLHQYAKYNPTLTSARLVSLVYPYNSSYSVYRIGTKIFSGPEQIYQVSQLSERELQTDCQLRIPFFFARSLICFNSYRWGVGGTPIYWLYGYVPLGMVFKPFGLVEGMVFKPFGLV